MPGGWFNGGGARWWVTLLLWRVWKFALRLLTGRCELQRICHQLYPLHRRSFLIGEG